MVSGVGVAALEEAVKGVGVSASKGASAGPGRWQAPSRSAAVSKAEVRRSGDLPIRLNYSLDITLRGSQRGGYSPSRYTREPGL